ncbi:flagellar biosynthetic protein FliS [Desulfosporosinus acidiphilus SJ4]|uniref:Flagellar biosynthetic protein FliS n=1 Tax=Desulfosporosinus acidiphilus (strain DSM 22704 / JCM 16185 / SJ4) TaxID=646529 RepID=U3GJN1_DESAJ|nr:flagellar export chaperone FliS [Desulfosporosinus acidiphilus]AFM42718.1 flagellar biosynthetic protein FliS [Desulfosporosinus acidiphilus SJ4]
MATKTITAKSDSAYDISALETASPEMLTLMLYDGALRFLQQARGALAEEDKESAAKWLGKLQDIFVELNTSLDMTQGEIAQNMRRLYEFYLQEVTLAQVEKSADRLQAVEEFLVRFRATWEEAARIYNTTKGLKQAESSDD